MFWTVSGDSWQNEHPTNISISYISIPNYLFSCSTQNETVGWFSWDNCWLYIYQSYLEFSFGMWLNVVFLSPTLGKVTSAQFVPDHHFCSWIFPVKPSGGAPWYAIQSTEANGLKFSCFLPVCITQIVKFLGLIFSVQEVTASWTVMESLSFMWLTATWTWTCFSG